MAEIIGLGFLVLFLVFGSLALNFVVWIWSVIDVVNSRSPNKTIFAILIVLIAPFSWIYAIFIGDNKFLKIFTMGSVASLMLSSVIVLVRLPTVVIEQQRLAKQKTVEIKSTQPTARAIPKVKPNARNFGLVSGLHVERVSKRNQEVSLAQYNSHGLVPDSLIATHKKMRAIAGKGSHLFGILGHPDMKFGRINHQNGLFQELPEPAGFSWPRAIAYNNNKNQLLVFGRSSAHFYNIKKRTFMKNAALAKLGVSGIIYRPKDKRYYAVTNNQLDKQYSNLLVISHSGAVIKSLDLSPPIPTKDMEPSLQLSFTKQGNIFAIHYDNELMKQVYYLINRKTGTVFGIKW